MDLGGASPPRGGSSSAWSSPFISPSCLAHTAARVRCWHALPGDAVVSGGVVVVHESLLIGWGCSRADAAKAMRIVVPVEPHCALLLLLQVGLGGPSTRRHPRLRVRVAGSKNDTRQHGLVDSAAAAKCAALSVCACVCGSMMRCVPLSVCVCACLRGVRCVQARMALACNAFIFLSCNFIF